MARAQRARNRPARSQTGAKKFSAQYGAMSDVGKYLQVFKRESDGKLRIAYDAFNSDQPAE